jgi:hypothetical protein
MISQEAITFLIECVWAYSPDIITQIKLTLNTAPSCLGFAKVAMPMVHPTCKTISSYKCLLQDPATADIWQTALGKDFGGMAHSDLKTRQKGTNSIFVMTHVEIANIPMNQSVTCSHVIANYHPQKANPHCIGITSGGNLINCPGELLTRTANLTMSNLMWNSIFSTEEAKYMCLDINFFYLVAPLDRLK